MPPAAAGEEVDSGRKERQQCGDEDELERPAVQKPGSEVDVGLRAARDLGGLVERAEERLRGKAELAEPVAAQGRERVALGRRRPAGARRDRDRRDPARDERGLLVEAEREGEVEELREGARVRRRNAGLCSDGGVGSGDELGLETRGVSPPNSMRAAGRPPTPSRFTTAARLSAYGAVSAKCAAPSLRESPRRSRRG